MTISKDILYVGVNDHEVDLFEGQYEVPEGMAYNSYVILDEKTAVIDSVDENFEEEWLSNIDRVLDGKTPDYIVVHHMEPDHSGSLKGFLDKYKETKVVASVGAFNMMKNFFGTDYADRKIVIKEGDKLELGSHTLTFITAPMVHWPEVVMSYESTDKVLFSADGFGKFGANDVENKEGWACEARRYYFGIVGKFGANVQAVLKKAAALDIQIICPLHGPVLNEDLGYYIDKYNTWSSYLPEDEGVTIAYTSVYGHTREVALMLEKMLTANGVEKIETFDLARDDEAEAVEAAFRYNKIVLATTTYNGGIFPKMRDFIDILIEHNYQNRTVALIEAGAWAPMAGKLMKEKLSPLKDIAFTENTVKILGGINDGVIAELETLAKELA